MAARLDAQDTEAGFDIMEGHPFDEAGEDFLLGRGGFRLHGCCWRFPEWRQSGSTNPRSEGVGDPISSPDTPWLIDFLGVLHLTVNFLSDETISDFVEIGGERAAQFLEFGPEDLLYKTAWRLDDHRLLVHPRIAEGPDPIATTEGNEELSRPAVGDRALDLLWPLTPGCFAKARPNALGSSPSGGLFTGCGAARKESFDLAKLFSKAVFGVHRVRSQPLGRPDDAPDDIQFLCVALIGPLPRERYGEPLQGPS